MRVTVLINAQVHPLQWYSEEANPETEYYYLILKRALIKQFNVVYA